MRVSRARALAIVVGVVAVLASPCPAIAQNVSAGPLAVRMRDDATDADVELIVSIATRLGVPLGFEAAGALDEGVSMPFKTQSSRDARKIVSVRPRPRDVRGLTLRQALDAAVASDRRYEWRELDGVVVVRPRAAWRDPEHPLCRRASDVRLEEAGASDPFEAVRQMVSPEATLFDLLNANARTYRGVHWSLRSEASRILLDRGRAVTVTEPMLTIGGSTTSRAFPLPSR